jgi:hypothetical protein
MYKEGDGEDYREVQLGGGTKVPPYPLPYPYMLRRVGGGRSLLCYRNKIFPITVIFYKAKGIYGY